MDFFNSWLPFIYLYVLGGIFFGFGLVILIKSRALNLSVKKHRRWIKVLVFGFLYFILIHFIITAAALYF